MADNLDERLAAEQERKQAERRTREAKYERGKKVLRYAGKKALKGQIKKQAVRIGIKALLPYLLPIIAIAAGILFIIFIVLAVLVSLCNADSLKGRLAYTAASVTGLIPDGFCDATSGLGGVVNYIDTAQVPPVEGEKCSVNIKPPAGSAIDCRTCLNLEQQNPPIPVKPRPPAGSTNGANPFADEEMASKLKGLLLVNNTWRVTEAFCPTVNHNSPAHYDGRAVDINLKPEYGDDKAKLARLYIDAKQTGFSKVICEYPENFLKDFGVPCGATEKTAGNHIHIEVPGL